MMLTTTVGAGGDISLRKPRSLLNRLFGAFQNWQVSLMRVEYMANRYRGIGHAIS